MSKKLDLPAFAAEIADAGLRGLAFTASATGELAFAAGVSPANRAAVQAVYDAHDADKAALRNYANTKQWALAIGGYTVAFAGGPTVAFDTSTEGQALITGKIARLQQANPPVAFNWQSGPAGFVNLSAAQLTAAGVAIADFVQATFDALGAVIAAINAGTIKSKAQVDSADWPSNSIEA